MANFVITTQSGRLTLADAQYIGDGVYIGFGPLGLVICTYNGVEASNVIHLEPEVQRALFDYLKQKGDC